MSRNPREVYQSELKKYQVQLDLLRLKHSRLGWLRLALILVVAIGSYQTFQVAGAWAFVVFGLGIGLFLWVVSVDADNNRKIRYLEQLVLLNKEELRILDGDFAHRYDGAGFLPPVHPYAHDLDLLGKYSLYQLINRCQGEQGRRMLANNLLEPLPIAEVVKRQEGVAELAPLSDWRQNLQASAALTPLTEATENRLRRWLEEPDTPFMHPAWRWVVPVYTVFACGVALAAILDLISGSLFSLFFIVFILVSFTLGKKATPTSARLSGVVVELETLQQVFQTLEQPRFTRSLLAQLQDRIGVGHNPAAAQIKSLKDILNRFDLRLNVFLFLFLNSFLLWDVRQLRALSRWRQHHAAGATAWFDVVGQFEVLASLATLRFNQPDWVQPKLDAGYFSFAAQNLGHPLIRTEQRVTSDFALQGKGQIALITGSNMAGKSTFLRSLGVNTVLAQMGAVVCATSCSLTPVQLLSSMRIADNLAENTSTFYAELKKLKTIIDAVKEHRPVFVLLDEILRGTNSLDRHTGTRALIGQLLRENSVAVLATHDVELAKLENQYPGKLANYHFDVQVEGQELYFDYKLKHGVCTNLNASVLMKKIGIELE